MKRLIVAACVSVGSVTAATAEEECKVEGLRHSLHKNNHYLEIQGSITCRCAKVIIRAYDGDKFIGTSTFPAFAEGYAFSTFITDLAAEPSAALNFKTDVTPMTCSGEK